MHARVQLVYFGEVLAGFERDDVQRRLGRALKLDERHAARLFSGKRKVLKRALERQDAERYATKLAKMGALVHIEPMPADAPAAPARARGWRTQWRVVAAGAAACAVVSAVALATFGERLWIAATGSPGIDRTATLPAEAMHALRTDYAAAPAHKAFVASAGGTWGWSGAAPSVEVAIAGATAHCEAERKRDAPPCELLNVNGEAMGR